MSYLAPDCRRERLRHSWAPRRPAKGGPIEEHTCSGERASPSENATRTAICARAPTAAAGSLAQHNAREGKVRVRVRWIMRPSYSKRRTPARRQTLTLPSNWIAHTLLLEALDAMLMYALEDCESQTPKVACMFSWSDTHGCARTREAREAQSLAYGECHTCTRHPSSGSTFDRRYASL